MAEFGRLIVTDKGSKLILKTIKSSEAICFTGLSVSSKKYQEDEFEDLVELGEIRQRSNVLETDIESSSSIKIRVILPNTDLTVGYQMRTVGLYASDPDDGEILYAVAAEMSDNGCYVSPYNNRTVSNLYFNLSVAVANSQNVQLTVDPGAVVTIKQLNSALDKTTNMVYQQATGYTDRKIAALINGAPEDLDTLKEIADAMAENHDVVEALNAAIGKKANQAEMDSLLGTKLDKTGDSKDAKVTFGSSDTLTPAAWTDVAVLKSGETHKSIFAKVSAMFKNIRYLWGLVSALSASGAITEVKIVEALPADAASHPKTFYWVKG